MKLNTAIGLGVDIHIDQVFYPDLAGHRGAYSAGRLASIKAVSLILLSIAVYLGFSEESCKHPGHTYFFIFEFILLQAPTNSHLRCKLPLASPHICASRITQLSPWFYCSASKPRFYEGFFQIARWFLLAVAESLSASLQAWSFLWRWSYAMLISHTNLKGFSDLLADTEFSPQQRSLVDTSLRAMVSGAN